VHLLYPETEKEQIQQFVKNELSHFCQKGKYIHDFVGTGAGVIYASPLASLRRPKDF